MGTLTALYSALSVNQWYAFAFAVLLGVLGGFALSMFIDKNNKIIRLDKGQIPTLLTVSLVIELVAAVYLLVFDSNLILYAQLHWLGLLVFTAVTIALLEMHLTSRRRLAAFGLMAWGLLGVVVMLLDAGLNLPLSSFAGAIGGAGGWQYLFGFGVAAGSTFGVSFAFTLLLVFSGVVFVDGLLKSLKKQKKRKR